MPTDYAGNTTAAARNLGTLTATTQTFTDWVGSTDTDDFYRFTLTDTRNLRLNLTGMSDDADVAIYADSGVVGTKARLIGRSFNGGTSSETVNLNYLGAGNYYVRVLSFAGDTNYNLALSALVPADLAGNTVATARDLGTLTTTTQTFTDWVGDADTNDYYRFSLGSASNLRLSLAGMSAAADVVLYAANGTTVVRRGVGSSDGLSEQLNIDNLAAGTYYARVYPFDGETSYSLAIAALPPNIPDNAGNTIATARNIGALSTTTQTFTDWVGSADANDYYRFTLDGISNLSVNLTGLGADANLVVYASNGTTALRTSANTGITDEAITINNLAAGTYYARVYPGVATANTNYSLSLAAQRPDAAGNTIATARNVGALSATTQTFTDWVGSTDSNDFYRFTTSSTSNLRLNLAGLGADANLVVYASNGTTVLRTGANTDVTSEAIAIDNLAAGTYYAQVYPGVATANTNYSLSLAAQTPVITDRAGNTVATARNLGYISTNTQTFADWIGTTDTDDYYMFMLNSPSHVQLDLTGLSADANVTVYTADGTSILGQGSNSGTTSESLRINNLGPNVYYARVVPGTSSTSTSYNLSLSTISAPTVLDSAGNSAATARNIGTLPTTPQIFNDRVDGSDGEDWYRFTTTEVRDLRIALMGPNISGYYGVPCRLYANDGTTLLTSTHLSQAGTIWNLNNRAAGTYYLQMYRYWWDDTNYSVSIAAPTVPTDNAGNFTAVARNIGNLTTTDSTFTDMVDEVDFNDYYRFTLNGPRNVRLNLTGLTANADVYVYAADGVTRVGSGVNGGTTSEAVSINNLTAGTYYALVYINTTTDRAHYTLSLLADIPGGTVGTVLTGGAGNDTLTGSSGSNTLAGGAGNDILRGNTHDDILVGDAGNDTLTGGTGADMFRFITTDNSGVDTITDFQSGTDKIQVVSPNFANIPVGTLAANRLVAAGTTLTNGNAVFFYNGTTGGLSFDRDGNGSAAAAQIATLTNRPTLAASDFQVVAA